MYNLYGKHLGAYLVVPVLWRVELGHSTVFTDDLRDQYPYFLLHGINGLMRVNLIEIIHADHNPAKTGWGRRERIGGAELDILPEKGDVIIFSGQEYAMQGKTLHLSERLNWYDIFITKIFK